MSEATAETLVLEPGYLTIHAAARELSVNHDTVLRYVHQGVKVPGLPERVRLRAYRVGGRYRVTPEDLKLFVEQQNPQHVVKLAGEARRRQQRAEAADKRLRKRLGQE